MTASVNIDITNNNINNINNTNNINNIHDVNLQPPAVPQPRASLPPEMQNARPAGRNILARVASFLLGAGAAGSASAFLGGGTLLSGVIGTTATAFLGATAVAGIATGGAALIGGAIGLGIFAGIRAIVNHFRRAPAPQPRVPINAGVPQVPPQADIYNHNTVAQAIRQAKALPSSLQQAAETVISRMRTIYGEALVPPETTLNKILGWGADRLANDISKLNDTVTPQKMEELVEKHMRQSMLYASLNKALMPLCGNDVFQTEEMRKMVATENSDLVENLTNATTHEEVQDIIGQFTDKVQTRKNEIVTKIQLANIPENLKNRWIEKARNGAISGEAMLQSLIENVPNLPDKFQPFMERNILLHSYAPKSAEKSLADARKLAEELSRWDNFDSSDEKSGMASVNEWYLEDISNSLYNDQTFDENGISSQLKLDAPRGFYTINDTVINGRAMPNKREAGTAVADAISKAMPTKEAAQMVSAIVNQRSFAPINMLSMQLGLEPKITDCLGKMASRDITGAGGMVHVDLSAHFPTLADNYYTVSIKNNKVHIELSELVGLDAGVGAGADSKPRLGGLARYTVHFECDLGQNGKNPHIESIHFQQELLPYEAEPVNAQ